jgi:hypothetical protein
MSKEYFDFLIHSFGLAISLGMIGCGQMSLYSEEIVPFFDELEYENGSLIRYDVSGKIKLFEDVIKENSCPSLR